MEGVNLYFLIQTLIRVQKLILFMDENECKYMKKNII